MHIFEENFELHLEASELFIYCMSYHRLANITALKTIILHTVIDMFCSRVGAHTTQLQNGCVNPGPVILVNNSKHQTVTSLSRVVCG